MSSKIKLKELSKDELIDVILGKEEKIKQLEKENDKLQKEKEKFEKELKKYKNANTPPSANKHIKPDTSGLKAKKGAKRGAPEGHKGATLILPRPDEIVPVPALECGNCRSTNIEPTGYVKERTIICHQKAKNIIKKYCQEEVRCLNCHTVTLASNKDIPDVGIYDKTIQSLVNYFKFKARLPHNIIVDIMNNVFNVPMTDPTSLAITRRASRKLEPEYGKLEELVRKQDVVNADETSCSVLGVNHWLWVFCNSLLSLFKFNRERGGDIVERVLGKDFNGKLVSDGWPTYTAYVRDTGVAHQRCWAHGKTEVEFECKAKHPKLYQFYCDIYANVRKGWKYKQEKRRLRMLEKCKAELAAWISLARNHKSLRKFAGKIENGGDDWFTCLLYPEVPPDNNEAERSIRPFVIIRKIIGCLRSEVGKRNYEVMMSLVSTWEKQGKNVFYTLQNTL